MFDDPERHRLMLTRAQHGRGIRRPRPGDVLLDEETGATVLVIEVDPVLRALADHGGATLRWELGGAWKVKRRKVASLRRLQFIREGDPVDVDMPAIMHRRGQREIQPGDVFEDLHDSERRVLVIEVLGDRARLSWFETGRGSTRASASLRRLRLVQEGGLGDPRGA